MASRVSHSASVEIKYKTTVKELKELLEKIPDTATVSVSTINGDRPWEADVDYLEFAWDGDL